MSGQLVGLVLALPPEAAAGVERLVLVALAEATNASGDGWCWPSVRSVAGDVAAHPGSVRRAITELADRKVIEVEHRSGRTSRYRVIVPSDEFPYRVGARTNPAQSARGRGGHSGSETPRKVRGTPRNLRGDPAQGARLTGKNRNGTGRSSSTKNQKRVEVEDADLARLLEDPERWP